MTQKKDVCFERTIKYNNFIFRDHQVYEVRILPGVTFLDMIYRFGSEFLGHSNFELKNILFQEPLAADLTFDQQVQVQFTFQNSCWHVNIHSKRVKDDRILEEKLHEIMRCILLTKDVQPDEINSFFPQEFIQSAQHEWDMEEIYGRVRSVQVVHGEFMKTLGKVYCRNQEELMVLHLSDLAEEYRTKFWAHPAFLDGATLAGVSLRLREVDSTMPQVLIPYIPFSIQRFCVYRPLPQTIYVYSRRPENKGKNKTSADLLTTDIRVYDHAGTILFEFEQITSKQIRNASLIQRLIVKEQEIKPLVTEISSFIPVSSNLEDTFASNLKQAIMTYIKEQVGKRIDKNPSEVKSNLPFYDLGMDSVSLLDLTRDLELFCQHEFYPTMLFEYNTIEELTAYLLENDKTSFEALVDEPGGENITEDFNAMNVSPAVETSYPPIVVSKPRIIRNEAPNTEEIAIIGLAGRYPGARNMEEFWQVVRAGKDCIAEIPQDRWPAEDYYSSDTYFDPMRPMTKSKWGGFITGADQFDSLFFNISPREAETLDPQLRILLEVCWHTLEDGGYTPDSYSRRKAGVYVGVMNNDYSWLAAEHYYRTGHYSGPGGHAHELANRVSYHLNFQGPSMTLSNACASSFTALHLARNALLHGECEVALAGGINLSLHPNKYWMLSRAGIISPENKERTFDKRAGGYVPGEGAGMVLLKPLSQALKDHDQVYGILRSSVLRHSGRGSGQYVPDTNTLKEGVLESLESSGINPLDFRYIECHGTGTQLGDIIEVQALSKAFSQYTNQIQYCALGSKANIGHLESASGICSLTKVLLSIKHGEIPICPNVQEINPGIRIEETPFYIPEKTQIWENVPEKRIAGVHSFGMGGSSGFLIVQGFEDSRPTEIEALRPEIIALSAKTESSLQTYVNEFIDYLEERKETGISLANMAYTLQVGREAMPHRLAVLAKNETQLCRKLRQFVAGKKEKDIYSSFITPQKEDELKGIFEGLDEEEFIQMLVSRGKWDKLADLWTRGVSLPWESIHRENEVWRISLPTYPFDRERYWLPEIDTKADDPAAVSVVTGSGHSLLHQNITQVPEGEVASKRLASNMGTLMLYPSWKEQAVGQEAVTSGYDKHVVILCELGKVFQEGIEHNLTGVHCLTLQSQQGDIDERYQTYAARIFEEIQSILNEKNKDKVLIQVVVPVRGEQQLFVGLSGLLKTAQLENPRIIGQLIAIEPEDDSAGIVEKLRENSGSPVSSQLQYRSGKRQVIEWSQLELPQEEGKLPWKDQGIYLITGGVGGLGLIFAREIAQKVKNPTIFLIGRSRLGDNEQAKLSELEVLGARIAYKQVDVSQKEEVYGVIQEIRNDVGGLDGIIHCAGVILDNFILKKTKEDLQKVLAPKVSGLVNLDQATKDLILDFFVFFSSASGVLGNPGQADYSAANAFMDAYATYRNSLVAAQERRGQTLSVNWPLWKEGGMQIDEVTEKMMKENMGIIAMQTLTGIKALYRAIASGKNQIIVLEGELARIKQKLFPLMTSFITEKITREQTELPEELSLQNKMISYLKQTISHTLKVKPEQLDVNVGLNKYGLDSIVVLEINNKLEQHFSNIPKTLFFEYNTISELADYFSKSHYEALTKFFNLKKLSGQADNSSGTISQKNKQLEYAEYQPAAVSTPIIHPAKQHNSQNVVCVNSPRPLQKQQTDNIAKHLVDQIESNTIFLDDVIKLSNIDIKHNVTIAPIAPILSESLLIHEEELNNNREIAKIIAEIDEKNPPVAYIRLLYPYLFISADKSQYLRVTIDQINKLIIPFVTTDKSIYQELLRYGQKTDQKILIVDKYYDWIDSKQTKLVPMGAVQNLDINQFTLAGNRMRKLRYLVEKFIKSGEVKTEEYQVTSNLPLSQMRDLMIRWSEGKKNIIHNSFVCMKDLLQKTLPASHRAFLTYHNNKLCSLIVMEKSKDGIYLMDQEFYDPKTAPLGHMEYAITEILEQLKKENAKIFSLGVTWYPFAFEDCLSDAAGWSWLKEQYDKQTLLSRIFRQGEANYQFKKKFGERGEPVFAYLPPDTPFSMLLNYWTVFYQNSLTATQLIEKISEISFAGAEDKPEGEPSKQIKWNLTKDERLKLISKTDRLYQLNYYGNPLDLMTDSWFLVQSDAVKKRTAYLQTKSHCETIERLREVFPFKHIILTNQGRIAEQIFYQAFPKTKKKVLTTIPWTTTLMQQLQNGFDVIELFDPSVLQCQSTNLFKGEMDLAALDEQLKTASHNIALAGLEVLSNASGGHPVRLSHICLLKTTLQQHQIPLVLDASRIVRNAVLLKQYEDNCRQRSIWDIIKQTSQQADYIVTSLTKDFAVPAGGLIATNDDQLAIEMKNIQSRDGLEITANIENMIIQAFSEKETIIDLVSKQMTATKRLQDMLLEAQAPILPPAYGHAVVIDVSELADGETNTQKKEQFLRTLFLETGIRAGIHQVGKQKNTILDQCIRLAFPLGLTKEDDECIYNALQKFFI